MMVGPIIVMPPRLPLYERSITVDFLDYYRRFDEQTGEMSYFFNIRFPALDGVPKTIEKNGRVFYYWKTEER